MDICRDSETEETGRKCGEEIKHEILLSKEFNDDFEKIRSRAEKGNNEAKYLLKLIEKGIEKLRVDKEAGKRIKKGLIPSYYNSKYEVTNLWNLNLDSFWRMIYTIMGTDVKLMIIVLEVLDHKSYDRRFGYG